jgi:hypothetical protein
LRPDKLHKGGRAASNGGQCARTTRGRAHRDCDLWLDTKIDGARCVVIYLRLTPAMFSLKGDCDQAQVQIRGAQPALLATPRGRVNAP